MGLTMTGLLWAHFKQLVELKVKFLKSTTPFEHVFKIIGTLKASSCAPFCQQCHNRNISPHFIAHSAETVRTVWSPRTEELL